MPSGLLRAIVCLALAAGDPAVGRTFDGDGSTVGRSGPSATGSGLNGRDRDPGGASLPHGAVLGLPAPRGATLVAAEQPLNNLAVTRQGTRILVGDARPGVCIWDAETGRQVSQLEFPAESLAQPVVCVGGAAQDEVLAHAGDRLAQWNSDVRAEVVALPGVVDGRLVSAFSPDGSRMALFQRQPPIRLLSLDHSDQARGTGVVDDDEAWADRIEYAPDGRHLAVSRFGRMYLFDAATGKRLWKARLEGTIRWHAFAANGQTIDALVDYDGLLRLDALTGQHAPPRRPERTRGGGPEHRVTSVSPDRTLVAETGEAVIRVWETATARDVLELRGHTSPVSDLEFLPDGRRLVSVTAHGEGFVWDLAAPAFSLLPPEAAELSREQSAELWRQLGDERGTNAWAALAALLQRPDEAVRLAADPPNPSARITSLIDELFDEQSRTRSRAERRLAALSVLAEEFLMDALETGPPPEPAARLRRLLDRLNGPAKQDELRKLQTARRHRALRLARLLEWIGTPAAREQLVRLIAETADPAVSEEARRRLERMSDEGC